MSLGTIQSNITPSNSALLTEGSMPLRHAPLPMSSIVEPASSLLAFGGKVFGGGSGAANVPQSLPKGQKILIFPGSENQIHQMTKGQFQKLTGKLPASMPVQRFIGNGRLISPHNAQLYQQGMWLFAVPTGLPAQSVSNRTYVSLAPGMKEALVELTHRAVMARYPSGVSAAEAVNAPVVGQYFSMYDYQQLWELQTRLNRGEGGPIGRQYQNMLGKLEKAYVQLVNEVVHRQSPTRIATGAGQSAVGATPQATVSSTQPALHPTISMEEAFPLPSTTPQDSVASATVNLAPPISRQAAIEHVLGDTQGLYRLGLQQALLLRVQGMSGPQILAYNRDLLNSPVTVDAIHTEARQWLRQQAISAIVQQVKNLDSNLTTESVEAAVEQSLSDRGINGWQAITQFAKDLPNSPQVLQSLVNQTRGLSTQATPAQPVASRSIPSTLGSTPTTSTPISGATQIQATQSLGYKDVIGATQKINIGSAANLTLTPMQQGGTQFFVGQVTANGKTHSKAFNTNSKTQAEQQAKAWVNTITEELLEKVLQPHKDAIQEVETAERRDWNFRHTQPSRPTSLSPEAEAIAKAKNSNAGNGPIQRDRVVADASAAELAWNQWQKENSDQAVQLVQALGNEFTAEKAMLIVNALKNNPTVMFQGLTPAELVRTALEKKITLERAIRDMEAQAVKDAQTYPLLELTPSNSMSSVVAQSENVTVVPEIKAKGFFAQPYNVYPIKSLNVLDARDGTSIKDTQGYDVVTIGTFFNRSWTSPNGKPISAGPLVIDNQYIEPGVPYAVARGVLAVLKDGTITIARQSTPNYSDPLFAAPGNNFASEKQLRGRFGDIKHFMGGGVLLIEGGQAVDLHDIVEHQQFNLRRKGVHELKRANHVVVAIKDGQAYLILAKMKTGYEIQRHLMSAGFTAAVKFDGGLARVYFREGYEVVSKSWGEHPFGLGVNIKK